MGRTALDSKRDAFWHFLAGHPKRAAALHYNIHRQGNPKMKRGKGRQADCQLLPQEPEI